MRSTATVTLTAQSRLRSPTRLRTQATLTVAAQGRLRQPRQVRATARITLTAAAIAPRGLGAQLKVIHDRLTTAVLQQYLQVWVNTTPPGLKLAVRVDDGPTVETAFTWENPNSGLPALFHIAESALPQDGFTHYLTVSVWRETAGVRSAAVQHTFTGKLPAPVVPQPEWIRPRLLRQNSTELPDLVEINFRASTAVMVIAQLRKGGGKTNIRLGVADRDDPRLLAEGIGTLFPYPDNKTYPIYFGVAGLRHGRESPIRWFDQPLMIQLSDGQPDKTIITPDTLAGTARTLNGQINAPSYTSTFRTEINAAVRTQLGTLPVNGNTIIDQAIYRLFLKLKEVIRKGGTVTLENLGTFGASWTHPRTTRDNVTGVHTVSPGYRQPTFTPSLGYKEGTKAGIILTDEEAKAP